MQPFRAALNPRSSIRRPLLAVLLALSAAAGVSVSASETSPDCAALLRSSEPAIAGRILAPIPGLYESIPVSSEALWRGGWTVEETIGGGDGWGQAVSFVRHHPRPGADFIYAQGELRRSARLLPASRGGGWLLELEAAYLDDETVLPDGQILKLPRWVSLPGVPELVPGKGTPTVAFFTLRQMKRMGIPFGGLRQLEMKEIENLTTIFEIENALKLRGLTPEDLSMGRVPEDVVDPILRSTHSLRYAETIALQSGHRIRRASIRKGSGMLRSVEEFFREVSVSSPSGTDSRAWATAARFGLEASSSVFFEFDIQIELEPVVP